MKSTEVDEEQMKQLHATIAEQLCRSLKFECVYLLAWESGSEARAGINKWV